MAGASDQRHFCIYPNSVTTAPTSATAGAIWIDQDPIYGEYNPFYQIELRGAVVETLGWRFTQVFPYVESGVQKSRYRRKILIKDEDYVLSRTTVNSLSALYNSLGTKYRFYDGESIYRVWFSFNPVGLQFQKALPAWWEGRMLSDPPGADYLFYSYEIILDVFEVANSAEGMT